jgi:hypothetical protein
MSRTIRRKNFKNPWAIIPDYAFHGDTLNYWSRKNKAMLKKLTTKKARKVPVIYDENTDEYSVKYHLNEDPWGFD